MKTNKRPYITVLSLFTLLAAGAQTPGGVGEPLSWKKSCHTTDSISLRGKGLTFVGVGQVTDNGNREQTLWSIGTPTSTTFLQTTSRTADLKRDAFMNYTNDTLPELRMYSYCNSSQDTSGKKLYIGHATQKGIPARDLQYPFKEYVIYDRALSLQERNRVESCLALNHGVTLQHSYLNSDGTVIWNHVTGKAYSHRIGGIIVDSISGLKRTKGSSSEKGSFLLVSDPALSEKQSLLWGDNNKPLRFVSSTAKGKWFQRQWKLSATNMQGEKVDVTASTRAVQQINPLTDGEYYWLAVDPTGSGEFPVRSVKYYKSATSSDDSLRFHDVTVTDDAIWSLRAGRNMFTSIQVSQSESPDSVGGTLDILITGGTPPYDNTLTKDQSVIYDHTSTDTLLTVINLPEGRYHLSTTDKMGIHDTKEFEITATGIRDLTYEDGNSQSDDMFRHVTASPNPTKDGNVDVEIETSQACPITLTLYTSGGQVVSRKEFGADSYQFTRICLPSSGVYLLKAECGKTERTLKLIRK